MNIICISLVYEKLNYKDKMILDEVLKTIQIPYERLFEVYENNKPKYFGISNPIIINKCNGSLLVATAQNLDKNLAIDLLKKLWIDCIEKEKIIFFQSLICKIKSYYDKDALVYLSETSVGMHSLVYGDIQVYSQVVNGLNNNKNYEDVIKLLNNIMIDVKKDTNISEGNISLERVLADCVERDKIKEITLLGYGKSGKLITKALTEKNIKVVVYTRKNDLKDEKMIKFKNYNQLDEKEKFNCIIALENNALTIELVKKIYKSFLNIYDISSPSLLSDLKIDKENNQLMVLNHFIDIGKKTENIRRKGNNAAENIILNHINKFLFNFTKNFTIKYEMKNLQSRNIIELRNSINYKIRKIMADNNFIEVDIPILLTLATESESTAFSMIFNNGKFYLKQSSQLLLQILVNSGFSRVYDISHVFRNEDIGINSMYEFQMFSCEWQNKKYRDVEKFFCNLIENILSDNKLGFNGIITISYDTAFKIINDSLNTNIKYGTMFNDNQLMVLSNYINKKYKTKFYIINKFPINFRRFYHSLDENDRVNTFKAYYENVCYASGGQRLTDKLEIERNLYLSNNYVDKYSAYIQILNDKIKHGGFSVSIDALITIILGLSTTNNCKVFKNIQL